MFLIAIFSATKWFLFSYFPLLLHDFYTVLYSFIYVLRNAIKIVIVYTNKLNLKFLFVIKKYIRRILLYYLHIIIGAAPSSSSSSVVANPFTSLNWVVIAL